MIKIETIMKTNFNIQKNVRNSHLASVLSAIGKLQVLGLVALLLLIGSGMVWGAYSSAPAGTYNLVTDASTLAVGDVVIIAGTNNSTTKAISTTQNSNNRASVDVTLSTSSITLAANNTVQGLTLEAGTTSGTFSFNTGDGYLYAASSSSNWLRTEASKTANSSWTISISDGAATITAQGTNTHNTMRYNHSANPVIFSCYTSSATTGALVNIYKKQASNYTVGFSVQPTGYGTVSQNSIAAVPTGSAITKGTGANVNKITIDGTTVTASPHEQDADYNYAFSGWSVPGNATTVTSAITITANFTRTARSMTNYRTVCDASAPALTTDPTSLSDMGYKFGGTPVAKSFSMSGENLTSGTLTVTAPTDYEICKTSGGTYAGSITFTGVSGTLSATTVYVRMKSGKAVGTYNDEKVSISGCGLAAAVKVNCSGSVYNEDLYKTGLHTSTYSTYATGVAKTGTYDMPSLADVTPGVECEGMHYHFVGWVTDANKEAGTIADNIIAASGSKTADNTTYWAVWMQEAGSTTYTKITSTSEVVDGVYVIINDRKYLPNANTTASGTPAFGETYAVTLSADGSTITSSVTDGMKWYFTMSEGKATIRNAASDGDYLYQTDDNNGMRIYTTPDTWTVEENSTGFALKGTTRSRYCAGATNYNNWRSYTTKNQANYADGGIIYLYKETTPYEDPVAECAPVTCGTPTSPTSASITAFGATLGWTANATGTLDHYEYIVWPATEAEPTSGYSSVATNSVTVSGLMSNTDYRWKVRKVCTGADGESMWLKSSFSTTGTTLTFSVPAGVSDVAGQTSTSALPSAGVPTNCGDCWAFMGWTPDDDYEGSATPTKFYKSGEFAHLTAADGTTLYAVYGKTEFGMIFSTTELVSNENYVLTVLYNNDEYALSNTDYGTYDAGVTNVTSLVHEDASNYYLFNVDAANIWKFTGTASSGQLYNAAASKYVNLTSTTNKLLNTADNLTFTVDEGYWKIKSTNYLYSESSSSFSVSELMDDEDYSALIYRQISVIFTTTPGCEEYTLSWKVQGEDYSDGTPSTSATTCSGIATLPTNPSALVCTDDFVGWSEQELTGTGNSKPTDLFLTIGNAPRIDEDKTFHAVFATVDTDVKISKSLTSEFTSKAWADEGSLWTSGKDGLALDAKGVQVSTAQSGANATTNDSYMEVTSVVITYGTSNSATGSVDVQVGTTSMDLSAGSISGGVSDQTLTYTPASPATSLTGRVKITVTTTNKSIYVKSVQINYSVYGYKDYITACTNEFTNSNGSGDGKWSTTTNWSLGSLPTIHQPAIIKKPVTVDVATAKAKEVVLNQSSTNTGSLEISAGKALTVAETVQKTTDGSTLVATGENDIVFGSTLAAGTGALVAGGYTSGDNKATVNFAVKAKKDGSGHWINQYIGTPFNDQGAVLYNYYGTQLYAFHPTNDGNYDSGTGSANDAWWSRLAETDGMNPFVGYNILCSKAETPVLWMQGTLNASDNQTINGSKLVYNGASNTENLLANSWMAPIHIEAFENGDFSNVEKTIYIFNAGSPDDYASAGDGAASATAAGQYIVLPIASAPWVSPTVTVIPAMQAFSVYATGANPSLTLDYNRLVYTPALTSVGVVPTRAPRRDKVAEDAPEVISLHVTAGSGYAANAYILGREDFADNFDDGWDGRFMEGDEAAPQLYAPTENGNLVINCVPNIEGTVVCFKRGSVDSEYTFTFSYEGEESWYLNDQKEQESTLISALDSYTFHSSADDMPARFVVSRTPIYKTPTGVENADGRNLKSDVRKIVIDDHVFIIRNGLMYDVTGALCK